MAYMTKKDITEEYRCSPGLVTKMANEMQKTGIYPKDFKIMSMGELRVDRDAFKHYALYRRQILKGLDYPPFKRSKS